MCHLDATYAGSSDARGDVIFCQNSLVQLAVIWEDELVLSMCLGLGLVFIQQEELIIGEGWDMLQEVEARGSRNFFWEVQLNTLSGELYKRYAALDK